MTTATKRSSNTDTRHSRALAIRERLLAWLPGNTRIENIGPFRVQMADAGAYQILFRTPFSGAVPEMKFDDHASAALWQAKGRETLPYGLDVWETYAEGGRQRSRKLLNLEWGHKGETALIAFGKGDWDASFLAALN